MSTKYSRVLPVLKAMSERGPLTRDEIASVSMIYGSRSGDRRSRNRLSDAIGMWVANEYIIKMPNEGRFGIGPKAARILAIASSGASSSRGYRTARKSVDESQVEGSLQNYLLGQLAHQPLTTGDLAALSGKSMTTVDENMRALANHGHARRVPQGKWEVLRSGPQVSGDRRGGR